MASESESANTTSIDADIDKKFAELIRSAKITAGARFRAAARLTKRDYMLTWMTALSSSYVIGLTIVPKFINLPKEVESNLGFVTVVFSVLILVSSLVQFAGRYSVDAEQHHRSALEVNEIRRDMELASGSGDHRKLSELVHQYNAVLQKFSINHDEIDLRTFHSEKPAEFPWVTGCWWKLTFFGLRCLNYAPLVVILTATAIFLWCLHYAYVSRIVIPIGK
jgi:hypothetical protein